MEKFTTLSSVAAPMVMANVTTDAMSPTQAAISTTADWGKLLFANWRYEADGSEKPDFILNRAPYRNCQILLSGENFGCGSSRERAVWSLMKFGIRCVIAPSFADIFRDNAFQNGLLPVALPAPAFESVRQAIDRSPEQPITVDLVRCVIQLPDHAVPFDVPAERRTALLEGLEEIDVILGLSGKIDSFQRADALARPWIYASE
jgi:3-isopropylmalate/(R)-2-methylmalate dehydratase small subunit